MSGSSLTPRFSGNLIGIALIIVATMVMILQHSLVKALAAEMSILEIVFFRTASAVLFFLPWMLRSGLAIFRTERMGLHILRATFQTFSAFGFFLGLAIVPLATVTALHFTAPIFAVLIGIFLLGERVSVRRWSAILAGFVGTMLILRPGIATVGYGEFLVLGSAVAWACAIIVIKVLSRTDTSVTITAYMYVLMTPATLIAASFDWTWPTLEQYGWLVAIGLTGAFGHVLTAEAPRRHPCRHTIRFLSSNLGDFDWHSVVWRIGRQSRLDWWCRRNRQRQLHRLARAPDRDFSDIHI
jgi:drug/metabolite transporter (DMT)-like permease